MPTENQFMNFFGFLKHSSCQTLSQIYLISHLGRINMFFLHVQKMYSLSRHLTCVLGP